MDFNFTDEQKMLRDSVGRYLQGAYDTEARRAITSSESGYSAEAWAQFAELGLLMAPFSEEDGGLGGGPIETLVVMEEFGRTLVVEPYIPTVVCAGGFLKHAGTAAQKEEHLAPIIGGERIFAFAYAEKQSRYDLFDVATTAKKDGAGYVLNGEKSVVIGAPWADHLIVTARTSGDRRDAGGVTVFIVPKDANGVSTRDYPTVDGLRASEVYLENVSVGADAVLGDVDGGLPLVEQVADEAIAALGAEAIGAMKSLHDATVEYSKTRKQFGVPIGKFQVLQHRMVDMFMAYEQSVSMTYMLTLRLDEDDIERKKAASAAKVQIGRAGRLIGQDAVQIHGGMGMTDELAVGHYFKRLTMIDTAFGNVDYHLRRHAMLANVDAVAAE